MCFPGSLPGCLAESSSSSVQENYQCDDDTLWIENDYIFVFATEVSEKTTTELGNALEENYMTFHVKTIKGKQSVSIATKNRKQLLYRMKLREDH